MRLRLRRYGGRSSVGRAQDCDSCGRGFNPRRPPHFFFLYFNRLQKSLVLPLGHLRAYGQMYVQMLRALFKLEKYKGCLYFFQRLDVGISMLKNSPQFPP